MRTTELITISLPQKMLKISEKIARAKHMTRSEFVRNALRTYIEGVHAEEAVQVYKNESREGTLKELKGSLVSLMRD